MFVTAMHRLQRVFYRLSDWLGPSPLNLIGLDARVQHVRAATAIGLVVGFAFSLFNLLTEGQRALGLTELVAVLLLLVPATLISRVPRWVALSELLLLLASMTIFGALIVFGGIEGTGIFWVYTVPFLVFFLKDQRRGWLFSLAFMAVMAVYLVWVSPLLAFSQHYSPVVITHFLLSFGFYVLVASAFNHIRTRFELQLQQGKQQAEAAVLAKSRFLAAASHDLRQPAHALGLFVARLTQLPNDAPTRELVAGVDASVRALQQMLDDFFDYSRLDAHAMQLRPCALPIADVFDQLRCSFASQASDKGLRLRFRPSPAWIQSDPVLLHRVLLNLVGNAVQYTERGSVLVACRPTRDGKQVRLEVRDSGIGIAKEHHATIFSEFFQVGNKERDRSKGIGLGLSIVERSCRLLNHPVTMRSRPGHGTRFVVRVPLAPTRPIARPVKAKLPVLGDLSGLLVLLIEDDPLGSAAMAGLLTTWGCRVTVARDAQLACKLLQLGPIPDFIVSDYRLPGEHNGIEAVRLLREAAAKEIAACLISGDTDASVRQQTAAAGLVLLQKPVRPAKLRSLLRKHEQAQAASTAALHLELA